MLQLRRSRASTAVIPAAALLMLSFGPAAAQSVANFYSGKTVNMLIGFTAGGGYDLYARTVARYMGRYIPGNPSIVPQNMPGAGSLNVVNYLYGVAPKDGTAMAHFAPGIMFEPLLGRSAADAGQFDATKFTWLGSASRPGSAWPFTPAPGVNA